MATHDYVIANGTGAAVRSDLNNALAAIVSQNSSRPGNEPKVPGASGARPVPNPKARKCTGSVRTVRASLSGTLLM